MALKRQSHHFHSDTAQCLEEAQPALKRLRLSSSEPDLEDAALAQQDQSSRLPELPGQCGQHQQMQHPDNSYMVMNALLKQLHLERLQRVQPAQRATEGTACGG